VGQVWENRFIIVTKFLFKRKEDNNKKLPSFYQSVICRVYLISGIVCANKAISGKPKNTKTKSIKEYDNLKAIT
jgi:hypothetical protein